MKVPLPVLPSHWSVKPLKYVVKFASGGTPNKDTEAYWNGGIPWVSPKDMKRAVIDSSEDTVSEAALQSTALSLQPKGSILIVVRGMILARYVPVAEAAVPVTINQDMKAMLVKRDHSPSFIRYYLSSIQELFSSLIEEAGHGTKTLRTELLAAVPVPLPPPAEQRTIVDFIDRESAKIDALVAKQEELIERIEEKRKSIIDRSVSRGIRTQIKAEPNDLRIAEEPPSDWRLIPFKWCCSIANGQVDPTIERYARLPLIAPNHIESGTGRLLAIESAEEQGAISGKYYYPAGTVIYSKIRPALRKACIAHSAGLCSADMYPIYSNVLTPDFLLFQLLSERFSLFAITESDRVAMPKINRETLGDFLMTVPPLDEQEEICRFISSEIQELDAACERIQGLIDSLIERRAALISAAVTGQIDALTKRPESNTNAANDNLQAFRAAVGAEIVSRHGSSKTLGRVKLQKLLYLAEVHAGVHELAGVYAREAAGPLARDLLSDTERGMAAAGYFSTVAPLGTGEGYTYARLGKAGAHRNQLASLLGQREVALESLIDRLKDYDTRQVEAITTLYAVWNDALLDGEAPDDDRIIRGVLEEWHPEKPDKFTTSDLKTWLAWMRRNGLVPTGTGSRTQIDRLFV